MSLKWKRRGSKELSGIVRYTKDSGKTWSYLVNPSNRQSATSAFQETGSEGHILLPNGKWTGGGPFYTARVYIDAPYRQISWFHPEVPSWIMEAQLRCPMNDIHLPAQYRGFVPTSFRSKDTSDLDDDGATAIAQVSPINPTSTLARFLSELHQEGIPSIPALQTLKKRIGIAKSAGSEFLNVEFGWLPIKEEVDELISSITHAHDIIVQYHRDAGKLVRREFTFDTEISEENKILKEAATASPNFTGSWEPPFGNQWFNSPMDLSQTIKVTSTKKFSGAFTYAPPGSSDSLTRMLGIGSDAQKLLGTTFTPTTLWEITPWSWLVDWFSNMGDVIHNFDQMALQGLVMPWGYMMEEKTIEITHKLIPTQSQKEKVGFVSGYPESRKILQSKVRRPANPFGFGIELADLSPIQIAILVALGITLV